ncbi:MAG: hypothetical protein K2O44_05480 [Clostridia bacterium]|nr:hypothetical protein [Clostridia bacterium]
MENILSIIGIIVPVVAIIISLWLFNKSLDNSRKVLLNKFLYFITYDSKILALICHSTKNGNITGAKVTESDINTYNKSLFALDRMLNDLNITTKLVFL